MSQDRIARLNTYIETMKQRLTAGIPEKHKNSSKEYLAWIQREIDLHTKILESLKK